MKIKPRKSQVLVKPEEEQSRVSASGLVTPDNVEQEQRAIGTVEAVGQGVDDLSAGDKVIYGAYAGEKISIKDSGEDIDYVILFEEDVLATICQTE